MSDKKEQTPKAKVSKVIADGLENTVANLGTNLDKREHSLFKNKKNLSLDGQQAELNALYRTDWISGKMVDIIPDDMTREWREFDGDLEPETIQALVDEEVRLQLQYNFNLAHKWARLYGTGFIIISVDDGKNPAEPLEINDIKPGDLKHIKAIDRHRLAYIEQPDTNPLSKNFGMPEFYNLLETDIKIHYSRLIRLEGIRLPYIEFRRNKYYSDSILARVYDSILNFNTAANASASMIYDTNVAIMKIQNLMQYFNSGEQEALLIKRMTMINAQKSMNNMVMLDSEEEVDWKNSNFAGLPELLDRYALYLSAGSDVPATRLLGSAASGLNATGEGDLKNYYDKLRSNQIIDYKPPLDYFDLLMAKNLGLPDDADLSYKFRPLFQMTPKEIAELQLTKANRDNIYLTQGVITETVAAKELQQDDTYSNVDADYIEALSEYEKEKVSLIPTEPQTELEKETRSESETTYINPGESP